MKEWWNNLALREKQIVTLGTLLGSFLLIYLFIWQPLDTKVFSLREQIQQNQKLLNWMIETNKQIQTFGKKDQHVKAQSKTGSLLSRIQKEINKNPLALSLDLLNQTEGDSVQLSFKKVNFDKLIAWLIEITKNQNLLITQIVIIPSTPLGIVSVDLVLKDM